MAQEHLFGMKDFSLDTGHGVTRRGAQRTVPMQVLVLGMPRTGTASMYSALQILGYQDVYHMVSCVKNLPDCDMWKEAIDSKFGSKKKSFGRAEWDELLGHCMAVTDMPCISFSPELVAAYPDAKVVLTTRDIDSWCKSIRTTIGNKITSPFVLAGEYIDPRYLGKWVGMAKMLWIAYFGSLTNDADVLKKKFVEHYDEVRRVVPPENLLEYRVGEGWEPLCKFLGKEIPSEPFPRVNDSANFDRSFAGVIKLRLQATLKKVSKVLIPLSVIGLAAYAIRDKGQLSFFHWND